MKAKEFVSKVFAKKRKCTLANQGCWRACCGVNRLEGSHCKQLSKRSNKWGSLRLRTEDSGRLLGVRRLPFES